MSKPSLSLLMLCAVLCGACGDNVGFDPTYQNQTRPVLTRLEITPDSIALLPKITTQLTIKAWDQYGTTIAEHFNGWGEGDWWGKTSYSSSAPEIAEVSSVGLVKGVAPGIARITATLTLDGVTRTATMKATVVGDPPSNVTVTVGQNGRWSPLTAYVKAGGTVTWVMPNGVQPGVMWLNVWDSNAEKLEFIDGRATRTFLTPGEFYYGTGLGLFWYEQGGIIRVF